MYGSLNRLLALQPVASRQGTCGVYLLDTESNGLTDCRCTLANLPILPGLPLWLGISGIVYIDYS